MHCVICCRFIWIVLCVVGYPVDCVMCCRFSWIVFCVGLCFPVDCVRCCRFLWILFYVVSSCELCYVL